MPLPDLIEITPLRGPVNADVAVPGSKSITNRALILAALSRGATTLRGALWSDDTEVMVEALRRLGFDLQVSPDPVTGDGGNRMIEVAGRGGRLDAGGTRDQPLTLQVGNAGTAARFLTMLTCLGEGFYRLEGVPRMDQRPQDALFQALRQLGYKIDSPNDRLPVLVQGGGRRPGKCRVDIARSSQFASALLLGAGTGGWEVEVTGHCSEHSPYVEMTRRLIEGFPTGGGAFEVEPDASSGSYFWAAGWLTRRSSASGVPEGEPGTRGGADPSARWPVRVRDWPRSEWQIDTRFPQLLPLPRVLSRERDLGDSIMTAIVLAADADSTAPDSSGEPFRFTDLGRLRLQECERVRALRRELTKCGADVVEEGDTLVIRPRRLHGAEIETYDDHRMAMCFATLGLKVPALRIQNPGCVRKTFPDFFARLAAPPPDGLGTIVMNARTRAPLAPADLLPANPGTAAGDPQPGPPLAPES